ncbi:MAG: hypothetical protein ACJ77U_10240 [Chloroflexota bacterium]
MSDNQSEVNPASPEGESLNGSFSSNGNGPGAIATDATGGGQDLSFLDDLAKAMRTTAAAEQARDSEITDQRRQSHLDAIRAREALEAEELRELAKEDVKGIDAWSDGEIKRIKLERERRIASRREQLQVRLEEHRLVIASEVEAVENAISGYRLETERFFDRLGSQTDPVEIARQAGTRPPFPDLDQIGPQQEAAPVAAYQAPAYEPPAYTPPAYTMSVTSIPAAPATPATTEAVADAADAPADAPAETAQPEATERTEASAAEPVGDPELAALVQTSEPAAETVVAEAPDQAETAPIDPNILIGVMDPAAGHDDQSGNGSPWAGGTDAVGEQAPVGDPIADAVVAVENSGASDGADEPVSVGAEARVVMPRTTGGAGSWLRWPNSSIDRSDPSR